VDAVASCGSIGVEWFGNAADRSYGIENHHRLHIYTHTNTNTRHYIGAATTRGRIGIYCQEEHNKQSTSTDKKLNRPSCDR
jgi:hypothetical protein